MKKLLLTATLSALALSLVVPHVALADIGSIPEVGNQFYGKVALIGKVIILIKGGIDISQAALSNDFPLVKKIFLYSAGTLLALVTLPIFLTMIEGVAKGLK